MTHTGTSHFISKAAALAYYRPYLGEPAYGKLQPGARGSRHEKDLENMRIVDAKLAEDEIHIGPPKLKPGQTLSINREEGRYFITEK